MVASRQPRTFTVEEYVNLEHRSSGAKNEPARLESVDVTLALAELYEGVELD